MGAELAVKLATHALVMVRWQPIITNVIRNWEGVMETFIMISLILSSLVVFHILGKLIIGEMFWGWVIVVALYILFFPITVPCSILYVFSLPFIYWNKKVELGKKRFFLEYIENNKIEILKKSETILEEWSKLSQEEQEVKALNALKKAAALKAQLERSK